MQKTFELQIVSPKGMTFQGTGECVTLETEQGLIQIKPGHADFLGTIDFTNIRVDMGDLQEHLVGRKGIVHVTNSLQRVDIILSYASHIKHVSFETMEAHLQRIDALLAKGEDLSDFHITFLNEEKVALEQMVKKKL